jgi:hypothetical protein
MQWVQFHSQQAVVYKTQPAAPAVVGRSRTWMMHHAKTIGYAVKFSRVRVVVYYPRFADGERLQSMRTDEVLYQRTPKDYNHKRNLGGGLAFLIKDSLNYCMLLLHLFRIIRHYHPFRSSQPNRL